MQESSSKLSPSAARAIRRGKAHTALRNCRDLPKSARLLGQELLALSNKRTGICNPSISRLAEALSIDEKTVRRSIATLIARGFLIVVKHGGRLTDTYHMAVEKLVALADVIATQIEKVCTAAAAAAKAARVAAGAKGAGIITAAREAAKAARKATQAIRDELTREPSPPVSKTRKNVSASSFVRAFCPRTLTRDINIPFRGEGLKFASKSGFWTAPGVPQGQHLTDQQLNGRASARIWDALKRLAPPQLAQFLERPDAEAIQDAAIKAERYQPGSGLVALSEALNIGGLA